MATFDIHVYADESGIHKDAPFCVLAGYIGGVRQWLRFDKDWAAVLRRYDVADFHSKDFFGFDGRGWRVGKYRRWSNPAEKGSDRDWPTEQAGDFLSDLLKTIVARRLSQVGAILDAEAFRALSYGERRHLTGGIFEGTRWASSGAPSKPYFLLFLHCLAHALSKTDPGKRILFVFDQQKVYESRALETFQEALTQVGTDDRDRLGGVVFRSRLEASGLQAADLYAHCWHRRATQPEALGAERQVVLDRLTPTKAAGLRIYTAAHFEKMLRELPQEMRERLRAEKEPGAN